MKLLQKEIIQNDDMQRLLLKYFALSSSYNRNKTSIPGIATIILKFSICPKRIKPIKIKRVFLICQEGEKVLFAHDTVSPSLGNSRY